MQLRDLEYFAAIAEHRGVRRAAEILNLSQPGLSKSLRRLEHELAAKLVVRTARGVELTAVGSALAGHVKRLQLSFHDVEREIFELSTGRGGHLRVGVNPLYADLLPEAYALLQCEAPSVTFSAVDSDNDVLVPALQKGDLDLIVNYIPESPIAGCEIERLSSDYDIVVYASSHHPLCRKKRLTLADLAGQGWVLSPINVQPWHWLSLAFQRQGQPPPHVAFETRSVRLRLQIVAVSLHLGFLARQVVKKASSQFRLRELPVQDAAWRRPIGVLYRKGAYLSPAARRFIEILRTTVKQK